MKTMLNYARVCALSVFPIFLICFCLPSARADSMHGTVTDPASAPIPGARVSAVNRVGVIAETVTNAAGRFELSVPDVTQVKLVITADGFLDGHDHLGSLGPDRTRSIAPITDSVCGDRFRGGRAANELGTS